MSKVETEVSTLKINRGTKAKIEENLSLIGENELIITTDEETPEIPPLPTTDGTYTLKVVVASGVATLSWVAE